MVCSALEVTDVLDGVCECLRWSLKLNWNQVDKWMLFSFPRWQSPELSRNCPAEWTSIEFPASLYLGSASGVNYSSLGRFRFSSYSIVKTSIANEAMKEFTMYEAEAVQDGFNCRGIGKDPMEMRINMTMAGESYSI